MQVIKVLADKKTLKYFTLFMLLIGTALYCFSLVMLKPNQLTLESPKKLAIIATHQDDGVISAGGMAIINDKLEGETSVIYILRPEADIERSIRYQEARDAWGLLPNNSASIRFLDIYPEDLSVEFVKTVLNKRLDSIFELESPDIIVFPLEEGGQRHHDMVAKAAPYVREKNPNITVLTAAEYNPLLLTEHMPEKLLMFFVRLLPFLPYYTPNSGIDKSKQFELMMSDQQLTKKKEMLLAFKSQKDVIPLSQFGYPDLFDNSNMADYSGIKILGKIFSFSGLALLSILVIYFFYIGLYIALKNVKPAINYIFIVIFAVPFLFAITSPAIFKEDFLLLAFSSLGFYTTFIFQTLRS